MPERRWLYEQNEQASVLNASRLEHDNAQIAAQRQGGNDPPPKRWWHKNDKWAVGFVCGLLVGGGFDAVMMHANGQAGLRVVFITAVCSIVAFVLLHENAKHIFPTEKTEHQFPTLIWAFCVGVAIPVFGWMLANTLADPNTLKIFPSLVGAVGMVVWYERMTGSRRLYPSRIPYAAGVAIPLEGPIGVGKKPLLDELEKHGVPVSHLARRQSPFLEDFYKDPSRWALPHQVWELAQSVHEQRDIINSGRSAVMIGSALSDYACHAKTLYDFLYDDLDQREWMTLELLGEEALKNEPLPPLWIYVTAGPCTLRKQIDCYGEDLERDRIPIRYLRNLCTAYGDLMGELALTTHVIHIDVDDLDLYRDDDERRAVAQHIIAVFQEMELWRPEEDREQSTLASRQHAQRLSPDTKDIGDPMRRTRDP